MCNIFSPIMDNYQGDLTDIIRASGAYGSCSTGTSSSEAAPFSSDHWQFSSGPMNFSSVLEDHSGKFGDPFSNMRDPFLHELDMLGSAYFNRASSAEIISSSGRLEEAACSGGGVAVTGSSNTSVLAQKVILNQDDDMRRPCNSILSNMIQVSPNAKLSISPGDSPVMASLSRVVKSSAEVSVKMVNQKTSKDHCLVANTGVQISSPRNPGLKRRKSQAKKSICIPAPAAPNSRQSGEVVPSDLWAWRKYGQKPIKGSPYPRSYYRCSSSKGCPARKQVERSRTDPNMLVITYSSEHNHPWPTQRNALAGSTRSQPSKNNVAASKNSESTQNGTTKPEGDLEQQESNTSDSNVSPQVITGNSTNCVAVKEEIDGIEKHIENMEDGEFSNGLPYKPSKLKCNQLEDLFAELGEIEADSMNLLSPQGFDAVDDDQQREFKALDPFHLFDWSEDNSTKYHLI